jgi:hypothetical protein
MDGSTLVTHHARIDAIADALTFALRQGGHEATDEAADYSTTFVLLRAARIVDELREAPIDSEVDRNRDYRRGYLMALADASARLRGQR